MVISSFRNILNEVMCTEEAVEGGGWKAECRAALLRVGVLAMRAHATPANRVPYGAKHSPGQLGALNVPCSAGDCSLLQLFRETALASSLKSFKTIYTLPPTDCTP